MGIEIACKCLDCGFNIDGCCIIDDNECTQTTKKILTQKDINLLLFLGLYGERVAK